MSSRIIIERLEFQGHCGVTSEERERPQMLAVDLELELPTEQAAQSDNLVQTVDYATVAEHIVSLASKESCHLLESLVERLVSMLFTEFPVERVRIWLRKLHAPLPMVAGSVGIRLERTRPTACQRPAVDLMPAPFLVQQYIRLPKGKALDVAAGTGRNTLYLLENGMEVEAIDRDGDALFQLDETARARHLSQLKTRTLDLERSDDPPDLGHERYDTILVFFYLFRPLLAPIMEALKPGGVLVYETFLIDNYFRHRHPRRWEFCLAHNELLRLTSPLRVLHYDEGEHRGSHGSAPVFTAQLVAQKFPHSLRAHESH
ncbi:MAG: dihydroneopterin aldolase [Nitrospiraceae bacterium]